MFDTVIHSTLEIASDPGHWVFELLSGGIFFAIGSVWHTFWQKGHDRDHHKPGFELVLRHLYELEADMDAISGVSPISRGPAELVFPEDGLRRTGWLTGGEVDRQFRSPSFVEDER